VEIKNLSFADGNNGDQKGLVPAPASTAGQKRSSSQLYNGVGGGG